MPRSTFRRYLRGLLFFAAGGLLLIAGFNALVNPFNLYEGLRLKDFNDYKYRLVRYQRLSKPAEVRRLQPDCLILGTSRMQVAMDPAHPGWDGCRTYNLALNRASYYESFRYLQHAMAIRRPRQIVLELEQVLGERTVAGGFLEERLAVRADGSPNPGWRQAFGRDLAAAIFSHPALQASWKTVFPDYLKRPRGPQDGFWEYTPVDRKLVRQGQRERFHRQEHESVAGLRGPVPNRPDKFQDVPRTPIDLDARSHQDGFESLRAILRLAHRDRIRLHLVIPPSHARLWDLYLEAGRWPLFEERKHIVVFINQDEARRANRDPFPLWDFSGFNTCTTEPVPPGEDRVSRMRWYWESQHFTRELGDLVLDRVLQVRDAKHPLPPDFGVRLDSRNLERHLAAIRVAGDRWRRSHPQDVAEVRSTVDRRLR